MICDDVRRFVYFYLDGNLGERKSHLLTLHIDGCSDCDGRVRLHRRLRDLVRARLSREPVPDTLRIRLRESLRTGSPRPLRPEAR